MQSQSPVYFVHVGKKRPTLHIYEGKDAKSTGCAVLFISKAQSSLWTLRSVTVLWRLLVTQTFIKSGLKSPYIRQIPYNKCCWVVNRWLTYLTLWIWIWIMCWTLLLWLMLPTPQRGKKSTGVRTGDSRRQILISLHRSGKGQSEAHNRMRHVPLPCFPYSTWLENWCGALWFGSINLVIITCVLFEDKPC